MNSLLVFIVFDITAKSFQIINIHCYNSERFSNIVVPSTAAVYCTCTYFVIMFTYYVGRIVNQTGLQIKALLTIVLG